VRLDASNRGVESRLTNKFAARKEVTRITRSLVRFSGSGKDTNAEAKNAFRAESSRVR
jgi:hypothetical protein